MKKLFPFCVVLLALTFGVTANADIAPSNADTYIDAYQTTNDAGIVAGEETTEFFGEPDVSVKPRGPARRFSSISKSVDTPQWPSPLVENCPDTSLYGQDPYTPNDAWTAGVSDQGHGLRRYEYVHASGQICDLHWWGLSLYLDGTNWVNCTGEAMTFDITFYEDDGGVPGDQICFYDDIMPAMTATGDLYNGNPLYRFDIENLAPCCSIGTAWISIDGSSVGSPQDCWFLWMGSASGNGISAMWDGVGWEYDAYDLSICVTGIYVPLYGACCNDANGACNSNIEIDDCPWPAARFVPNTFCANIQPPCGSVRGACCDDQGYCSQTLQTDCIGSWYANTSCAPNPCPPEAPPCTLVCPVNGIPEGESDCHYNWDDTTNGGCNSDIPVFTTINAGDTICGTAGTYSFYDPQQDTTRVYRDTDWYEIEITADDMLTWTGYAEYPFQLIIIDAGSRDCSDYESLDGIIVPACSTATLSVPVTPGYYWLWAGSPLGTMVHCGSPYIVTAQLSGVAPTGACCVQVDCVATLTHSECDALSGDWYWQEQCPDFDCPIDYCGLAVYSNGPPDGGWILASQCDNSYPFFAGTADEFELPVTDSLTITHIVSWHLPWTGQTSTPDDWDGLNVTIYENNTGTTPPSPGGQPTNNDLVCQHVDIITDGVVYSTTLAPGAFTDILVGPDFWQIISPVNVTLDGGVTYWLEVEPIMDYATYGQVAWYSTAIVNGLMPQMIFPVAGIPNWSTITTDDSVDMAFCLYSPDWAPIGRCCYDDTLCVDTTLAGCNDLGGTWDDTLNCIDNPCPPPGCDYVVGDVNGSDSYNGLDITFGVAYFKGGTDPFCPFGSCTIPPCDAFFYCGDVNGSCSYNGLDITYGVAYFKGGPDPMPCADCPPIE